MRAFSEPTLYCRKGNRRAVFCTAQYIPIQGPYEAFEPVKKQIVLYKKYRTSNYIL